MIKAIIKIGLLALAVMLFFPCTPVRAAVIKIGLTGLVDYVNDPYNLLEGGVTEGDPITGFYIYDPQTTDSDPSVYTGAYWHTTSPYGLYVTIGDLSFQTDTTNPKLLIGVSNNFYGEQSDSFIVNSYNNLSLDDSTFVDSLYWGMYDYDGIALSNDALPLLPLDLSEWESIYLTTSGHKYPLPPGIDKMTFDIGGSITSLYIIPEPVTLCLTGMGFLLMRRRLKS